jgi:hypothetical protein
LIHAEALFDGADDLPAIPAGALIVEDRVQPVRVTAGDGDRDVRQLVLGDGRRGLRELGEPLEAVAVELVAVKERADVLRGDLPALLAGDVPGQGDAKHAGLELEADAF